MEGEKSQIVGLGKQKTLVIWYFVLQVDKNGYNWYLPKDCKEIDIGTEYGTEYGPTYTSTSNTLVPSIPQLFFKNNASGCCTIVYK